MTEPVTLVTGATGFLGRHVARRLLDAGRPVVALARARDGEAAADRVARAVGGSGESGRLETIESDLTRMSTLDASVWASLRERVETVIHCAGDTTFFPQRIAAFRASHVDGPLALLGALAGGRLRRWMHVSTAFVCGRRTGPVLESEDDIGQGFHNPYERAKLESELAVRDAGSRVGIDVRIARPAIVVGDAPATAGGTPSTRFFDFIRLLAAFAPLSRRGNVDVRIQARPRAPFNIVPVEDTARIIVALAEHSDGAATTCHVVASNAPTQQQMLTWISACLGVRGIRLVDRDLGPLSDLSPLERAIDSAIGPYREYLEQEVRFDDRTTRRLLGSVGTPPAIVDTEAVGLLVERAVGPGPAATLRLA